MLPYVDKTLATNTPSGRVKRSVTGLADARVFARYTLIQNDAQGRTFRVAPFFGVELPTGDDDESDSLGRVPAPLQLGSGSWDPFGGVVLTYQTLAYQLDAQASYKINTRANGFEFGDEGRLDASFQYRLWPRSLDDSNVPGYLYGVIEGNLIEKDENQSNGTDDPNSGGTSMFLSPGLQYVSKRWIVEGIVQLPVSQDLNGTALEDNYTIRLGVRFNF